MSNMMDQQTLEAEQKKLSQEKEKQEEKQELGSMRMLDVFIEQGVGDISGEQVMETVTRTQAEANAEKLRLGIRIQRPRTEPVRPDTPPDMPVEEHSNLSSSQRRKLKNRQKDYERKAKKKGFAHATCETLPIVKAMEKSVVSEDALYDRTEDEWREYLFGTGYSVDLFKPAYDKKRETTYDIPEIKRQIAHSDHLIARYQMKNETLGPQEQAELNVIIRIAAAAREAYRTIVGANGVSMDGTPISAEEAELCAATKDEAVATYRSIVWNRLSLISDEVWSVIQDDFKEREKIVAGEDRAYIESRLSAEDEDYYEKIKKLDFEFSNYISAEDYLSNLKLLDKNPAAYEANKAAVDKIFAEYTACEKISADYARGAKQVAALGSGLFENAKFTMDVEAKLQGRFNGSAEYKAITKRITMLQGMLRALFTDKEAEADAHLALEKEFGIVTEERARIKDGIDMLNDVEQKQALFERELREMAERKEREEYFPSNPEEVPAFMADRIATMKRAEDNAEFDNRELVANFKFDKRALKIFGGGYDKDENGEPKTLLDAEKREQCKKYYEDMTSGDHERMTPHLTRIIDRVLSYMPTREMLHSEYLERHVDEICKMGNEMTYVENIIIDHKWFYDQLPKEKKELLKASSNYFMQFCATSDFAIKLKGVETNKGRLYTSSEMVSIQRDLGPQMRGALGDFSDKEKEYEDYFQAHTAYYELQKTARERTPEEKLATATLYTRLQEEKTRERDACLELIKGEFAEGELESFMRSGEHSRVAFRMDTGLGREVNLARLRTEVLWWRNFNAIARATGDDAAALLPVYEQLKSDLKTETFNLLNYVELLDLDYDQLMSRADEIVRTEMSIMHLTDLTRMKNPVTQVSMKEELLGPELVKAFSAVAERMVAYKSFIKSSGLALEDSVLESDSKRFVSSGSDAGVRATLMREFLRGVRQESAVAEKTAAFTKSWRESPPVLPPDVPPPLYAPRNN